MNEESSIEQVFNLLDQIYKLTENIKNSFDEEYNEMALKKIAVLRDTINQILKDEGIDDENYWRNKEWI